MRPGGRSSVWLLVAAAGAAVLCCAGPALLILAVSGVGAVVLQVGVSVIVGTGLAAAAAIGTLVWWRRRACGRRTVPTLHGPHESSG